MDKQQVFEFILYKLIRWVSSIKHHSDLEKFNIQNDFSKLKVLKLLFFTCSVNPELLRIFQKFHAMPYGHVESDIYDIIKRNSLDRYEITNEKTTVKTTLPGYPEFACLENSFHNNPLFKSIHESVELLKKSNEQLIEYSAIKLVDLSHSWYSWKIMYSFAERHKKYSELIPTNIIESEPKIFHLP